MLIGYARCSTDEQNLDLQRDALKAAGCEVIFEDQGISGAAKTRPGLDAALARLAAGDVLVIWKLDRLGRDLRHLVNFVHDLGERGAGFRVLAGEGAMIDTTTNGGRLVFHLFAALAEFERGLIRERVKAGMDAAKRRGKHVGRPRRLEPHQVAAARKLLDSGEETVASVAAMFKVGTVTLWRALRESGNGNGNSNGQGKRRKAGCA
jgi:DNA invertase Pin-like site-specific DNA recombinase